MIKTRNKLPSLPSKLITVALRDLEKVEADKKYKISMGLWHEPETTYDDATSSWKHTGICEICFAGAVMAKTLKVPNYLDVTPSNTSFNEIDASKLTALDCFRVGDVAIGLSHMKIAKPAGLQDEYYVAEYYASPDKFKRGMRKMVERLEKHGL